MSYETGDRPLRRAVDICIGRAETMLTVGLDEDAGRASYLACFHAAQALIFERTGKSAKSHNGVQTKFLELSKDDMRVDRHLRRFLSRSYDFKSAADYFTSGGDDAISPQQAADAVATAKRFVEHVVTLL